MNVITLRSLKAAITSGARLDASSLILNRGSPLHPIYHPGRIPPFASARYQGHGLSSAEDDRGMGANIARFEELSLAVRARAFTSDNDCHEDGQKKLKDALATLNFHPEHMPVIKHAVLRNALAWMVRSRASFHGCVSAEARPKVGGFLQLVGCEIQPDEDDESGALDISSLELPIALSFICCWFRAPLIANACKISSLDISGSVLDGIDANNISINGDMYMRRTTVLSVASFASANISGVFDASDALIVPYKTIHDRQTKEFDHGVLNLTQASVGNDAFFNRTRIWGGLSLRGAKFRRTVYMQRALVASPMAVLSNRAAVVMDGGRTPGDGEPAEGRAFNDWGRNDRYSINLRAHANALAETMHSDAVGKEHLITIELLDGVRPNSVGGLTRSQSVLRHMLKESLRARISAIRADSVHIDGCLFVHGASIYGRTRLKFAKITSNVELADVHIYSGESIRLDLDSRERYVEKKIEELNISCKTNAENKLCYLRGVFAVRSSTGNELRLDRGAHYPDDYVLDLRHANIGGDVSFKRGEISEFQWDSSGSGSAGVAHCAVVVGRICVDKSEINGSLITHDTLFPWQPWTFFVTIGDSGDGFNPLNIYSKFRANAELKEKFEQWHGKIPKGPNEYRQARALPAIGTPVISARATTIGRDVDMRLSKKLWGLSLQDAKVGGSIYFSDHSRVLKISGDPDHAAKGFGGNDGFEAKIGSRALHVSGVVDLTNASVAGDAILLFDADAGPDIRAQFSSISGRLEIYPQVFSERFQGPGIRCRFSLLRQENLYSHNELLSYPVRLMRLSNFFGVSMYLAREGERIGANNIPIFRSCTHVPLTMSVSVNEEHRLSYLQCKACKAVLSRRFLRKAGAENREQIEFVDEWYIDLRNARATFFAHLAQAWPHPSALSLDGFVYERSSVLGPLAPAYPNISSRPEDRHLPFERAYSGRSSLFFLLRSREAQFFLVFGIVIATVTATILCYVIPLVANFAFSSLIALDFNITLVWSLWLVSLGAYQLAARNSPTAYEAQPMALQYLRRQRTEINRYQRIKFAYWPLHPYLVAANALRESGRYLSANIVDMERIRRRVEMLSFRHHGPVKIILLLLGRICGYGYDFSRLATVFFGSVLLFASLFTTGAAFGYLCHTNNISYVQFDKDNHQTTTLASKCGNGVFTDCPGIAYAIDVMVPGLDLGKSSWAGSDIVDRPDGERFLAAGFAVLPGLAKIWGWILSAVFGAAIASRVGAAFSRQVE